MITKMGKSKLALKCEESQIEKMVSEIIGTYNGVFTFNHLCQRVCDNADKQDLLKKESNTNYSEIELDKNATILVHKIVWEKIWSHEIVLDLINDEYDYTPGRGVKLRKI